MLKVDHQDSKNTDKNTDKEFFIQYSQIGKKNNVDINKILNRVKLDKKNQIKKEIMFYCSISLTLFFLGTLIAIAK